MMLGSNYNHLHAGLAEYPDPLVRVKRGRIEELRGFLAGTPFPVSESVYSEVYECRHFQTLPLKLPLVGDKPRSHRLLHPEIRLDGEVNPPGEKLSLTLSCTGCDQ